MRLPIWIIIVLLLRVPAVQATAFHIAIQPTTQTQMIQPQIEQVLVHQRYWFQQARRALNRHDMKKFHRLRAKLINYPLSPYLDIWYARSVLKQGNDKQVLATLAQYPAIPEIINLRRAWMRSLVKRGRWLRAKGMMIRFPRLMSRMPDLVMLIFWHTGKKAKALRLYAARWQQGKKVQFIMLHLHKAWFKQGHPTIQERWKRIEHLAKHGQWQNIRHVAKPLPKQQNKWLKYWRLVQKNPEQALRKWPDSMADGPAAMIISDGIKRLSRSDPDKAWQWLKKRQSSSNHLNNLLLKLERRTALKAARRHLPEAADWLASLPSQFQNEDTRGWRVRLYILQHDWINILKAIASMPEIEQHQSRWMYWMARAAAATGQPEVAKYIFAKLATARGYYSFLSAEHIGQPFYLSTSEIIASDQSIAAIVNMAAVRRTYEWLQLGLHNKAAREWYHALAGSSTQQWEAAAVLASRWRWYDQAIRAAFKANHMDDLVRRFPLAFKYGVMKAAKKTGLMPAEIWSIIRQESAFNQQAVSYVGARGLMQLMPRTAKHIARKLGMGKVRPSLLSSVTNIWLGATYLAAQKKRFGNLALAVAAYNAGPHRVYRWLSRTPYDAPEAWVEAIPFNETRQYVQQVMAFVTVYEWRLHKVPTSLIARLHEQVQKVTQVETHLMTIP